MPVSISHLVIEPYAGSVPGINELAMLLAPSATNSRLGLMLYPNLAPFCFAETMLSQITYDRNHTNSAPSDLVLSTQKRRTAHTAVDVVRRRYRTLDDRKGNLKNEAPVFIGTEPRISTPSSSQPNSADSTGLWDEYRTMTTHSIESTYPLKQ